MEQIDIEVNNKKFTVKELLATDFDKIDFSNKVEGIKMQVKLSTGISDEEYSTLTLKERIKIITAINKINGLEDFTKQSN